VHHENSNQRGNASNGGSHNFTHGSANNYPERGLIPVHYAQHPRTGLREIKGRLAGQRARIERGFRSGLITRMEFRRLMAEQHHIQSLERAYLADGFLTYRERNELRRRLDLASRHIMRESHDAQRRF
jgi:hypothetical protein